jgi:hypothetical protein
VPFALSVNLNVYNSAFERKQKYRIREERISSFTTAPLLIDKISTEKFVGVITLLIEVTRNSGKVLSTLFYAVPRYTSIINYYTNY